VTYEPRRLDMFLREKNTKHLVEVLDLDELFDPVKPAFSGRLNVGEEMPDPDRFIKADVCFPSGEALPRCWIDVHYRDDELRR
jgi:hypothetical protein